MEDLERPWCTSTHYTRLRECFLAWANDASVFMGGKGLAFPNTEVRKGPVYVKLIEPGTLWDPMPQQVLKLIFGSLASFRSQKTTLLRANQMIWRIIPIHFCFVCLFSISANVFIINYQVNLGGVDSSIGRKCSCEEYAPPLSKNVYWGAYSSQYPRWALDYKAYVRCCTSEGFSKPLHNHFQLPSSDYSDPVGCVINHCYFLWPFSPHYSVIFR